VKALPPSLQDAFVSGMGKPIPYGDEEIVLGDRWDLAGPAVVEVRFVGGEIFDQQSVRLSVKKTGQISLSDGSTTKVVAIHDKDNLPRFARHRVDPKRDSLLVYNSYFVSRGGQEFEESWTGNAGMIVTPLSETVRRYECSDGNGPFDRTDLAFEIEILPSDAPWLPTEIYK
jgi:hypothetical protein